MNIKQPEHAAGVQIQIYYKSWMTSERKSYKNIIPNYRIIYHFQYVGHLSFERAHHNAARHSSPIGSFS
ncbi:MAG: hypothetical protein IJO61_03545, partial [Oscillospiraceae bacterium]|nr:hypothetical protein [Oscillospiraceae bacterium]